MKTITLNLTDREADLLQILTAINTSVTRVVVENSAFHADERHRTGNSKKDQKHEVILLLDTLRRATREAGVTV